MKINKERLEVPKFWIDWNDNYVKEEWSMDEDKIVVGEDKEWASYFYGNKPNRLEYNLDIKYLSQCYNRAMLVVWLCQECKVEEGKEGDNEEDIKEEEKEEAKYEEEEEEDADEVVQEKEARKSQKDDNNDSNSM